MLKLHMVQLELEAMEKQICDLLDNRPSCMSEGLR